MRRQNKEVIFKVYAECGDYCIGTFATYEEAEAAARYCEDRYHQSYIIKEGWK